MLLWTACCHIQWDNRFYIGSYILYVSFILNHVCMYACMYVLIYVCTVNTACTNWDNRFYIYRELLYHFDCFVWHPYV